MDDTRYFRELALYRTLSVKQLLTELQTLRRQLQNLDTAPAARQSALRRFEIAWYIYEEKGGNIFHVFPLLSSSGTPSEG
jgi:hypothetical protein